MKPRYSFRRILSFPALILAGSIATPCVQAASDSWSVDAAGNWATFGSWLSGTQEPGSTTTDNTDIATFNMLLTLAGKTVTVDTDRYIGGISFGNTSAFGYTLATGILHLNSGGVIQTLAGNGNHTDTISSAIVISGSSGATATITAGATSATSLLNIGAVTGSATSGNTTTLTLNGTNTGANLVSGIIGDGAGTGKLALNKSGAGTWVLTGANTYTGATTLSAGGLTLGGASGALALSSSAISLAGGTLTLDNTGAGNNNTGRIADTQAIRLGGGNLAYKGSDQASTNSTETVGAITQAGGSDAITVTFSGTNTATLTATSFIHTLGNASTLVNGTSLGKDTASIASVGRLILGSAPTLVGTTAALGTGINSAVKNTQIVPFLVGEATATTGGLGTQTGTANTFLTYDAGTGLRPLNLTDEFTNNAITAGTNTRITAATTAAATASINSLIIAGADLSIADGQTLTDTSGALLFASSNTIKPSGTTGVLDFGSAEAMVTVNSTLTGTISAKSITGSGGLTKSGAGTLTLIGTPSYTGGTVIDAGTLYLRTDTFSPNGTLFAIGNVTVQSGATLQGERANLSGTLTLNGGTWVENNGFGGGWTGSVILGADSFINNGFNQSVAGNISGAGGLTKNGVGTLTLTPTTSNSYGGTTTVNAGAVVFANTGAIGGSGRSVTVNAGSAVALNAATDPSAMFSRIVQTSAGAISLNANSSAAIDFNAAGFTNMSLGSLGNVTYTGTLTPYGTTYRLGGSTGNATTNVLTLTNANALTGSGNSLVVSGNVTLTAANNYTGGTTLSTGFLALNGATAVGSGTLTVNGGTLVLNHGSALGSAAVAINGGTLDSSGNTRILTGNTQNWNANFTFTGTQNLDLGTGAVSLGTTAGTRTVTVNGNALSIGGIISDGTATALTKAGGGTLILAGANNYSGATTISAGTLQFNSLGAIAGSGRNVTVGGNTMAAGYAINNAFLQRINNTAQPTGTIALAADSGNNLDFSSDVNGANLTGAYLGASGTGAMGNGIYTYSGTLTPNGSTYRLGGGGGTLVMSNSNAVTGAGKSLTVNGNVVLAASNDYTGGTTLTSGTLTLNNAGNIGSGTLVISGGTLNSTNGADVTLSTNNAQTWGGNFTYSGAFGPTNGPSSLNLGTGAVSMGASARTVTVTNKTLIVGGTITGTSLNALDITKAGNGTLVLSAPVTLRTGQTNTTNAGITQIDGLVSAAFGFTKAGAGTLTLTNSGNSFGSASNITINGGLLSVTSDAALGNSGNIVLLNTASTGLQFNLDGGGNGSAANSFAHQINTTTAGGYLDVTQNGTTTPAVTNVATLTKAFNNGTASANGITKTGDGILDISVDNTANYTGVITVNAGAIRVSNAGALGATANNTVVANSIGAAVQLSGVSTAETFNISNSGINTGGAIENFSGTNDLTGAITLAAAATIGADTGTTLNIKGGISGAFGLTLNTIGTGSININTAAINANVTGITKLGGGTLTFDVNSNLVVAPITVNAGVFDIKTGVLGGTGLVSVAPGASINLTSTTANRLGGRPLTLGGGILNDSGAAAETTGAFTLNAGQSIINNTSGSTLTLGAAAPAFANSGRGTTALFKGGSTIKFGATPTLTGAGANSTSTKGVLPWAIIDAGSGVGSGFATVDVGGTTVRALSGLESASTLAAGANAALTGGATPSAAATTTINSLTLNSGGGVTMSNAANAAAATQLTVTSGGILSNATSSISGGVLSLGNGYIFTPGASESSNVLTITSAITGTTLTKAGAGTLVLGSISGAFPGYTANNFSGGAHDGAFFINEGTVQLGSTGSPANNALYQYSNNDANAITVNSGGKLDLNGSTQLVGPILSQGFSSNVMLNANTVAGGIITSSTGYGNIIAITGNPSGNGQYGFTGSITGAHVGLAVGGGSQSAQMLMGANTYGGPTLVAGVGSSTAVGLILKNDGTMSNTSDITINGGALVIDNTGLSNNNDRVNNNAAISMSSGGLYYLGRAQNASTETVGAITLARGNNNINVTTGGTGVNSADLTIGGLSRTAGNSATAVFTNVSGLAGNNTGRINVLDPATGNPATIASLTTAGVLVNGIIPWAVNGGNFASYIPYATVNGVTSGGIGYLGQTGYAAYTGTILPTLDNPTGNYNVTNAIIGSSITINSLRAASTPVTFANDSYLLNLTSGGLIAGDNNPSGPIGAYVDNGRITAGGSAASGVADLSIWATTRQKPLNSRIVDSGIGTAKTRLVLYGDSGFIMSDGNNSYTGGTVVNASGNLNLVLTLNNASSGVVIPNAATPADGLVLNNCTLTMSNSAGQIGSGNIVTLNSAALSLYGSNTLAGLNLNALGAASTVSTSPTGTLTLTGGITTTGTNINGSAINCAVSLASGTTLNVGAATFNGQILNPLSADLTFGSTVTGGGGAMTKSGSGVLQFNGLATFNSGSLNVTGGGLQIGVASFSASPLDLTLQDGAWLNLNSRNTTFGSLAAPGTGMVTNTSTTPATLTVGGTNADTVFAGSFKRFNDQALNTINLTKVGTGTMTLSGSSNTGLGVTTVSAGKLLVNGALTSNGAVNVASTATLGGTGSIAGAVTVSSGGILSPGAGVGTLNLGGGLTLAAGSIYDWENNTINALGSAGTNWDVTNVTSGSTTLSSTVSTGTKLKLDFTNAYTSFSNSFWNLSRTWDFITGGVSAAIDASNISVYINSVLQGSGNTISNQGSFTTVATGGKLELVWTPVASTDPYDQWAIDTGLIGLNNGLDQDADGDSLTNLVEYAFDTLPLDASSGPPAITYDAGAHTISKHGSPAIRSTTVMNAVFGRRQNFEEAGLTYTVLFSADLTNWEPSSYTISSGDILASDATIDVVQVPYPATIFGGTKVPKFFRIQVTKN